MSNVELLECTLRDGSYAVDFQFTSDFTFQLAAELDRLKFPYIEVGHGMGIDASDKVVRAAASDRAYAEATKNAVVKSKWGMFAIPGIANPKNVNNFFAEGMDFVRVGVDAFALEKGIEFIKIVKSESEGKEIFVNFMKSYALDVDSLLDRVRAIEDLDVTGVYLVDSAGGMLPNELEIYSNALEKLNSKLKLGFHGHDNLGLAVSHSLKLASSGFDLIDCTMQGIGRSSGNASTERLVSILNRLEVDKSYDINEVLKVGERLVRPKFLQPGFSGLDTLAGFLLFHTAYMDDLITVSREFEVDPYMLMQEHCKISITSGSHDEISAVAKSMISNGHSYLGSYPLDRYFGHEQ
jgi:4-hydroxy 2-oxovalerate aldolase